MKRLHRVLAAAVCFGLASLCALAQIPEQYPKPLLHTPKDHPADRVLIVSVNGLHAVDLANFVDTHPHSTLATLSRHGVTYSNARVPWPDPAAGLLAFATGGSPISTGVFSSDGFDRRGASPGGTPLHLRVNSIFDQVHDAGGRTVWADESAAQVNLLQGPKGHALDEAFPAASVSGTEDEARVAALLGCLDRKYVPPPQLLGLTLSGVDTAKRTLPQVYLDSMATPAGGLEAALRKADDAIGSLVAALKQHKLEDSTWIIVTAAYAGGPLDDRKLRVVDPAKVLAVAVSVAGAPVAKIVTGTATNIWLKDPARVPAMAAAFRAQMPALGIADIYTGARLRLAMNAPADDPRMPDMVLEPEQGVVWAAAGTTARPRPNGGFSDAETHVALLVSGRQLTGRTDKTPLPSTQIAPLISRILGMEKFGLDALHAEHTPALPGIF